MSHVFDHESVGSGVGGERHRMSQAENVKLSTFALELLENGGEKDQKFSDHTDSGTLCSAWHTREVLDAIQQMILPRHSVSQTYLPFFKSSRCLMRVFLLKWCKSEPNAHLLKHKLNFDVI